MRWRVQAVARCRELQANRFNRRAERRRLTRYRYSARTFREESVRVLHIGIHTVHVHVLVTSSRYRYRDAKSRSELCLQMNLLTLDPNIPVGATPLTARLLVAGHLRD